MAQVTVDLNSADELAFFDLVATALHPGRGKFTGWNDFYDALIIHFRYTEDRLDITLKEGKNKVLAKDIAVLVKDLGEDGVGSQVSCAFEPRIS